MIKMHTTFDLLLNGVPYLVKITRFVFNSEVRYSVRYNGGPENIFVWDEQLQRFTAIGDGAVEIPDDIEDAIASRLLQMTLETKMGAN